jgi:hypothetical protein
MTETILSRIVTKPCPFGFKETPHLRPLVMPVRTVEISARQQDRRRLDRTQNISAARQRRKTSSYGNHVDMTWESQFTETEKRGWS